MNIDIVIDIIHLKMKTVPKENKNIEDIIIEANDILFHFKSCNLIKMI